jgi:predicted amidohydrolase
MATNTLTIALIHELFHDDRASERLRQRLEEARQAGAELALLPELPLNAWTMAGKTPRPEDAEEPGGPRQTQLAEAARHVGIGVAGGIIALDGTTGRRFNRALLMDASGQTVATYDKLHIPSEEGWWERFHYQEGEHPPQPVDQFGMPLGLQICSDLFRPTGCHLLAAAGAEIILAPRASATAGYGNWLAMIRANAITSCCYVLSTNRPCSESGVALGGPGVAVGPDGSVLSESTDPVSVVTLTHEAVLAARREYPGYLSVRSDIYARGWSGIASGDIQSKSTQEN